jgi:LPS sulfotransferase NodH
LFLFVQLRRKTKWEQRVCLISARQGFTFKIHGIPVGIAAALDRIAFVRLIKGNLDREILKGK